MKKLIAASVAMAISPLCADELKTTAADQTHLNVTIYNSNVALVKDQRQLRLPLGEGTLAFAEVSASIQPETAILTADGVTLLEQNFEYDLLSPESLLQKFVGKSVTLKSKVGDKTLTETATILANNDGVVLQVGDEIRTDSFAENIIFADVPADLRDRPTLTMVLDNTVSAEQSVALSYLTQNLNWKADYVAAIRDDQTLDLKGWVTVTNNSGTTYRDAQLQLVAGEVNRVMPERPHAGIMMKAQMMETAQPKAMQEESLFEYHLYSLPRPTTIKNNQQKQVSLLQVENIPYSKQLLVQASDPYGWSAWNNAEYQDLTVSAMLAIDNNTASQLGRPLPAGVVRTYQKDSQGNLQFIGEDRIDHTPENETIKLALGQSFDITAKRKQTDFNSERLTQQNAVKKIRQTVVTATYEVLFKNAKANEVTVDYQERLMGNWHIQSQSLPSEKINSTVNRWRVNIPPKGETTLTFTVKLIY